MRCTTLLALLTGVILYLVMGALVFSTLESPDERLAYTDLLATKDTFLHNNSCVTEVDFHRLVKVPWESVEHPFYSNSIQTDRIWGGLLFFLKIKINLSHGLLNPTPPPPAGSGVCGGSGPGCERPS